MCVPGRSLPSRSWGSRSSTTSGRALEARLTKTASASDADRQFSALLREVSQGAGITVTSHGKPVARTSPVKSPRRDREAARKRLLARLEHQDVTGQRTRSREDPYD